MKYFCPSCVNDVEGLGNRPTMACSKFTGGSSECTRPFLLIKTQLAASAYPSLSFIYGLTILMPLSECGSKFITEGFITEGFSKKETYANKMEVYTAQKYSEQRL